jgi:hypothetical protein
MAMLRLLLGRHGSLPLQVRHSVLSTADLAGTPFCFEPGVKHGRRRDAFGALERAGFRSQRPSFLCEPTCRALKFGPISRLRSACCIPCAPLKGNPPTTGPRDSNIGSSRIALADGRAGNWIGMD